MLGDIQLVLGLVEILLQDLDRFFVNAFFSKLLVVIKFDFFKLFPRVIIFLKHVRILSHD